MMPQIVHQFLEPVLPGIFAQQAFFFTFMPDFCGVASDAI
jgi:hypothetical protein